MKGYLFQDHYQETLLWLPAICLVGCLATFWWLRAKTPEVPYSISETAYKSRTYFTEFCLFCSTFLTVYAGWRMAQYPFDTLDDAGIWIASIGLPWLARYWDYVGKYKVQHYIIAAGIFGGLAFAFSRFWWQFILVSAVVGAFAKKSKIFWAEATLIHLIIMWQLFINYIYY